MRFRPLRRAALAAAIPALFLAIVSLPWRGQPPPAPPRLASRGACRGPLSAGVGEARFELPAGATIAGFPRGDWASEGTPDPVGAHALVVQVEGCRFAVASAELLLVPAPLAEAVRTRVADLALDGVFLGATHTHAGPGGYWDQALAEVGGVGPYDPRTAASLADGIAAAIRAAAGAVGPARVGARVVGAESLVSGRGGGTREGRLALVRLARPDGAPLAEVVVLASHPTLLGKANRRIGGDWAGLFLAERPHGLRLFFQGSLGDQSAVLAGGRPDPAAYARAVSDAADVEVPLAPSAETALGWARFEVSLPPLEPGAVPRWLRPALRTLLGGAAPASAPVTALRIGPALLVGVPAEPVAAVGTGWRARAGDDAVLVSLVDDYVGYAETPERFLAGEGETGRTVLGPDLAARLGDGVAAAVAAVR